MKKLGRSALVAAPLLALSFGLLSPRDASADAASAGNAYCVVPPFISANIQPNLVLMIDNSASMYDLQYQDTVNMYCGNAPTTSCTPGTTCSGSAICNQAGVTNTESIHSPKPCTDNNQCPVSGSKCSSGFCTKCDLVNGNANCVTTDNTIFTPVSCSRDTDCQPPNQYGVAGDTCNNKCNVPHVCFDATYNNSTTYSGYFTPTDTYSYDFSNNKFVGGAAMPSGSCDHAAGSPRYVCINTSGSGTTETIDTTSSGFTATGNFLNWLSASKFDIEKQFLTGGKYDPTNQVLVGESRGCGGRKFVKSVAGTTINFAVRGGTSGGISATQTLATEYGQTYLDIFIGDYNADECVSAMNDWTNMSTVSLGPFQNDTKGCVGAGTTAGSVDATSVWNHILHNCYQGNTTGSQGYSTNLNSLEGECMSVYSTLAPGTITDPNSGAAICSSVLSYVEPSSNTASVGYLGTCYNSVTKTFSSPCDATQMQNYCAVNVNTNPVVDPPTATPSQTTAAPGFIMEQGLLNTVQVGTLRVQIQAATAPTGLINKYKDQIRFGAMTFQNNGSGSECGSSAFPCYKACSTTRSRVCYLNSDCPSGETCDTLPKTDGAVMVGYVGAGYCSTHTGTACTVDTDCLTGETCTPSIGTHSSGLIRAIDDITASSWTPLAEGFYNAMGYLARTNAYGTTDPPTSRSDANFNSLPSPNTAASYLTNKNPSRYKCQRNNVLLVTDGASTADQNSASEALATLYASQVPYKIGTTTYTPGSAGYDSSNVHGQSAGGACPKYSGSRSIADLAWVAKNRNIKNLATSGTASTTAPTYSSESISTYVVFSGNATSAPGLCDPFTLMNNTAINGGTTLYQATNPTTLYTSLDTALSSIAAQTSSGTAASILSNSEGSGANIVQAVFYPSKMFLNNTSTTWIGEMQNLWYYVDPMINNSSIREDTRSPNVLNLLEDNVVSLRFDSATNTTWAYVSQDTDGNGLPNTTETQVKADDVKSIWRAGKRLWERTSSRNILTSTDGATLLPFTTLNSVTLAPYLNVDATAALSLIPYIRGTEYAGTYRSRSVTDKNSSGTTLSRPWLLGDIISSTPRIESSVRLNSYGLSSPGGYGDPSYSSFVGSNDYKNRGMVYVGANDGMLHAFNLGILDVTASGYQKATLRPTVDASGNAVPMGEEQWAYIPKQVLPYLKYYADPGYNHIYYVDGGTVLTDASIGDHGGANGCSSSDYDTCIKFSSVVDGSNNVDSNKNTWRTVLVGGMGLGGASGCGSSNCVSTPATVGTNALGYSSYYALDVTNPLSPTLLWEFSNSALGYATSGPAIVRVGDPLKNGRWYAVFGSGPTGPVDTVNHQFGGNSDQNLKFFVVDLRTGELVKTIDTGIQNAFAGSMISGAIDPDRWNPNVTGNYKDDAIYVGYVKKATDGTWTDGGVGRIVTNETTADDAAHPWTFSKVLDGIGPVTGAISRLQDRRNHNLWLFFGTGRFYNKTGTTLDDPTNRRAIFGIKEPCYNTSTKPGDRLDNTCSITLSAGDITDQSGGTSASSLAAADSIGTGWKIVLDEAVDGFGAERVVSDTVALTNGTIFVTSFMPTADPCNFGGNSFLWALDYKSGNRPADAALAGKALIQLSTGEFKQVDLTQAFGAGSARLFRRTSAAMTGKPPADAFPVVSKSANKPVKRILHIQER